MSSTSGCRSALQIAATIITALEYEHTDVLGDNLADIAAAKAGIVKGGSTVILARQPLLGARGALHSVLAPLQPQAIVDAPARYTATMSPPELQDGTRALSDLVSGVPHAIQMLRRDLGRRPFCCRDVAVAGFL